ncbi:MAG: AAA family ATPase [Patescibacteria group bacterium]|nr:AAA family ATPase [Patescibacteria group bacterium]MDD5164464.1 AAA family ATPase [Patescibacteria group bacterium]MDD5534383.1 AAA family ATPase [Patescibacteria group bacterium]
MEFIICPTCNGEGSFGGKLCRTCNGRGIYAWSGGYLIYSKKVLDREEILIDRIRKILHCVGRFLLITFGIIGILSLLKALWDIQKGGWSYFILSKEVLFLLFWISIITDAYLVYSIERTNEEKQKISPKTKRKSEWLPFAWPEISVLSHSLKIEVVESLSGEARILMEKAWVLACRLGHEKIEPIHLFLASLQVPNVALVINRLGLNWDALKERVSSVLSKISINKKKREIYYSLEAKKVLINAYDLAGQKKSKSLSSLDILESLASFEGPIKEILYDLEIGITEIKNVCLWIKIYEDLRHEHGYFFSQARLKPKGSINRAYTATATPYLDAYGEDLTLLARNGYLSVCIDREQETEGIFRIFESGRQSIVLVSPPGVGKTTIIHGIARRMVTEDVPPFLQDKRLVSISIPALISGASQPGEIEERIQIIMSEIARSRNIILFIKDIHNMSGVQTTKGELDIAEILANALKNKLFLVIATSTPNEYKRLIETKSLGQVLEKIEISEPDKNTTIQILEANMAVTEGRERVYFSYGALNQAIDLSVRYLNERYLPEKAINLLQEVAIFVKNVKGERAIVQGEDVAELISQKTKIPIAKITEKETEKLLHMEELIHKRLIDQNEAVGMVATALRRARTELRSMKKPIVNLLFLGPTGVGKTELAKTVAAVYFGDENKMIRLDMSEYQEKDSINRLIGIPGGEKGGQLTESIRANPSAILLLDEIEKAHPDILNVFLQVMDDGRLTDALGKTIDFTNVILIGTSNAGTDFIQEEIRKGTSVQTIQEVLIREKLKPFFRPEFLNRFDGVIVFKPLGIEEVRQIAKLTLNKLASQLEQKGIALKVTEDAVNELAQAGFDPIFGARPLQRVIQTKVNDALAQFLLTGKLGRRDVVVLDKGGEIRVEKAVSI